MKIHFIAIGGSVMHSIAISLHSQGHIITGSDDQIYEPAKSNLDALGILPKEYGWFPEKIHNELDIVVLGMHAKQDNPELIKAQELGLTIQSFPQLIYEFSKNMTRIAVCGSHGKTTTSAMLTHILLENDQTTNFVVGGKIHSKGTSIELNPQNNLIVIEGDEYLSSPLDLSSKFLHYKADIAILTGIAWDHINVFPTYASYLNTFGKLLGSLNQNASCIYNSDDAEVVSIVEETERKDINFIPISTKGLEIKQEGEYSILTYKGSSYKFSFFGNHNISNAMHAVYAAHAAGVPLEGALQSLVSFVGVGKRMDKIPHSGKAIAYRDFAHSPSKVKACINGVVNQFGDSHSITAVVELHTFSSIDKKFWPEYKGIFQEVNQGYFFVDKVAFQAKGKQINYQELIKTLEISEEQLLSDAELLKKLWKKEKNQANHVLVFMSSGNFANTSFEE